MATDKIAPEIYYQNLAKRHMAAAVMIFNEKGELLVLKPSYRDNWLLPGGVVEHGETLLQAAVREVKEEIGVDMKIKSIRCVDMKPGQGMMPDSVQSIFESEIISNAQLSDIQLDNEEITEYAFLPLQEALKRITPTAAVRIGQALVAREQNTVFYLEDGQNPFHDVQQG